MGLTSASPGRRTQRLAATALLVWSSLPAAAGVPVRRPPEVIRLWPGAVPGGSDAKTPERTFQQRVDWKDQLVTISVSDPTITVVRPPRGKANGTAMIVAPGGGFVSLVWDLEGTEIAAWLTARGITAFLLKYRVSLPGPGAANPRDATASAKALETRRVRAVADAAQAITLVRQQAARWGIKPDRIGMMGFSAGAATTMGVVLERDATQRPNFAAPIYGGAFLEDVRVPADAPPLFIVHAQDDPSVPASASTAIFDAWTKAKRPAELHIYNQGGHGFGMRAQGLPVDRWSTDFEAWLSSRGYIDRSVLRTPSALTKASPVKTSVHAKEPFSTAVTEFGVLIDNPRARTVLDKCLPGFTTGDQVGSIRSLTLKEIQGFLPEVLTDVKLAAIDRELERLPVPAGRRVRSNGAVSHGTSFGVGRGAACISS